MGKILTQDFVFNYYKKYGYTLNSIYNKSNSKDSVICPNGHEIQMRFGGFRFGSRCLKCSGKEKLTQDEVLSYYKQYDYILNSNYINGRVKDKLTCPNGHNIEMQFNNFKQGKRCIICSGRKKLTYEYIKEYIESVNYKLLSYTYINTITPIMIQCPKQHTYMVRFSNFQNNKRCKICYKDRNMGDLHPNWIMDRTRQTRSNYLRFDLRKINLLSTDINYNDYIVYKRSSNILQKNIYSVDHIYPRIAFIDNDLDHIYDVKLIKKICNLRENLRIIHEKENGEKSGKYNQDEFMEWFNAKLKELNI